MIGFRKALANRQWKATTLVCVGLDPLIEKLPACMTGRGMVEANDVEEWMVEIVDTTAPFACMFKPQIAHWEAIPDGVVALKSVISHIHNNYDIPVFLDCKRGDIARTQQQYRKACLDELGADGMNFSPYMGKDCMAALVDKEKPGRALVGLCYTSNPDAREVQDAVLADGRQYWEFIADRTLSWAKALGVVQDAGLVMAAAYEQTKGSGKIHSKHLRLCRQIVNDDLWFLIPGVGAQKGFVAETVSAAYAGPGSIAINSSSEINFASSGEDFAEAAGKKAMELRDTINNTVSSLTVL